MSGAAFSHLPTQDCTAAGSSDCRQIRKHVHTGYTQTNTHTHQKKEERLEKKGGKNRKHQKKEKQRGDQDRKKEGKKKGRKENRGMKGKNERKGAKKIKKKGKKIDNQSSSNMISCVSFRVYVEGLDLGLGTIPRGL